jgi:hypothetical protein
MENQKKTPISKINKSNLKDINQYIGNIYCPGANNAKINIPEMTFANKGFVLRNLIEAIKIISHLSTEQGGDVPIVVSEVIVTLSELSESFMFDYEAEFLDDLLNTESKKEIVEIEKL